MAERTLKPPEETGKPPDKRLDAPEKDLVWNPEPNAPWRPSDPERKPARMGEQKVRDKGLT